MFYRRQLPHFQPSRATYFVTFRLAGSLPKSVLIRIKEKREQVNQILRSVKNDTIRIRLFKEYSRIIFQKFNQQPSNEGPFWLRDPEIAQMVTEAIRYPDGKKYRLIAYCIMPNHVHIVFTLLDEETGHSSSSSYPVTKILQDLKWFTALKANQYLGRRGKFWQHESYDHVVRNGRDLERILHYVMNNPVKAGLVNDEKEWKWSYCRYSY